MCRPFALPFASFCALPCATSSFCAPCVPPRSFAVALPLGRSLLKCVVFLRSFLRFAVLKPWLFNEQWKCSYFDSCSKMTNLASQMPVCGVLLIECQSYLMCHSDFAEFAVIPLFWSWTTVQVDLFYAAMLCMECFLIACYHMLKQNCGFT